MPKQKRISQTKMDLITAICQRKITFDKLSGSDKFDVGSIMTSVVHKEISGHTLTGDEAVVSKLLEGYRTPSETKAHKSR